MGLVIANGKTATELTAGVTASGAVAVVTETEKDLTVNADASATNSETGVGVALGILTANSNTELTVAENVQITAASVKLGSVMPETEEEEAEEDTAAEGEEAEAEETLGNGINNIAIHTNSGAGASNVGVAGSVAIAVVNMGYEAVLPVDV